MGSRYRTLEISERLIAFTYSVLSNFNVLLVERTIVILSISLFPLNHGTSIVSDHNPSNDRYSVLYRQMTQIPHIVV